jgi:catechol 2,3-dioxygenase-like lactoylglutathione lyase family enzyme
LLKYAAMTQAKIESISPSFIVSNVSRTIAFYQANLGFEAMYQQPDEDPFFAALQRDGVMFFVKSDKDTQPQPNSSRNPEMKWDAYLYVPDPDALAAEFAGNGVSFHKPLGITSEGLRGFEIRDPDGYVLFFGRPK